MRLPPFFDPLLFSIDLFFTAVAGTFCLLIYFRTREIYQLTKHQGIRYFRDAFLFFGLSYFLRFLFHLVLLSWIAFDFMPPRGMFAPFFILLLGYFSTIGIFYLIFSTIWKKFNNRHLLVFGHSIAILLSVISFITRSHLILLYFQSALLVLAILLIVVRKHEKKISRMRIMYFLIALIWLINLWIIGPRRKPFPFEMQILVELISIGVFAFIYYKLSKWVR